MPPSPKANGGVTKFKPPPNPKPGAPKKPGSAAQPPAAANKAAPGKAAPSKAAPAPSKAAPPAEPAVVVAGGSDPFVKSESVYGLDSSNFRPFIDSKDVALVLFYEPENSNSHWCRPRFIKAAESTTMPNRVYAAVDCLNSSKVCRAEQIPNLPFYKLYSKGHLVTDIGLYSDFNSDTMKKYVENAPVLEEEIPPVKKCDK